MASDASKAAPRPSKLQASRSFTRYQTTTSDAGSPRQRSRTSTLSNQVLSDSPLDVNSSTDKSNASSLARSGITASPSATASSNTSLFEKPADESEVDTPTDINGHANPLASPLDNLPPDFDALPVEIASWADRFVADLTSAKIFPQPPSIEMLSDIFQEFYTKAEDRIGTHIKTLATRQSRNNSPARRSVRRGRSTRDELRRSSTTDGHIGQPMLTPGEVHEKRRAKRLLEYKRMLLEETAERHVTSALYSKLWRHKSTLDEVRDDKLRGKTGSLQVVGIGLKELGVDLYTGGALVEGSETPAARAIMVEEGISQAATGLLKMNEAPYPKGKLDELITAHQRIVELLTQVHRGSSSADEILPTLIYTLIASPAEGLNIISNMNYIQRFRAANKMTGEAAYCLTNLEAAITFLETVDLATLRGEEAIISTPSEKPTSQSQPSTPLTATFAGKPKTVTAKTPKALGITLEADKGDASKESAIASRPASSQAPRSVHHRRLSSLMSFPTNAFNSANDAVDQSLRNVSTTLDSSFKFLFGRLKEQQVAQGKDDSALKSPVVVPKTLDEARKVLTPKIGFDDEASETSSLQGADDDHPLQDKNDGGEDEKEDRVLGLFIGKGKSIPAAKLQDASAESKRSDTSASEPIKSTTSPAVGGTGPGLSDNTTDTSWTFGGSFTAFNRLTNKGFMNNVRSLGRTGAQPGTDEQQQPPVPAKDQEMKVSAVPETSSTDNTAGLAANQTTVKRDLSKLKPPPLQRYIDVKSIDELRVGELQGLLDEYHRVVEHLQKSELA